MGATVPASGSVPFSKQRTGANHGKPLSLNFLTAFDGNLLTKPSKVTLKKAYSSRGAKNFVALNSRRKSAVHPDLGP